MFDKEPTRFVLWSGIGIGLILGMSIPAMIFLWANWVMI